jgi:hypothetical protein
MLTVSHIILDEKTSEVEKLRECGARGDYKASHSSSCGRKSKES